MIDYRTDDTDAPLYCANHPKEQTYLRCGKCGKPICKKCRVSTPVGFRCYTCANIQVLPTYAISTDYYIKAALAGLGVAAVAGILMGFFPAWEFWTALLMGFGVPEAIAFVSNQKRGPGLQWISMGSVVFGFIVSRVVMQAFHVYGVPSAMPVLNQLPFYVTQYSILWLALALFLANRRLR